jgi:N-acetylglucosamine malate deacetylase 1
MKNIIFIAAHPDDETLGCGGTILKHKKNGDRIFWLIVTNLTKVGGFETRTINQRQIEIEKVSKEYDFDGVFKLDIPTMSLSSGSITKLIPNISNIFNKIRPEIIYTMNRSDAHSDHRIIFDAVMACTKSFRYPFVKRVLMYECLSETEFAPMLSEKIFQPNYFIDITNFMDKKIEIMKIYKSELGEHPFPRSIKNIKALGTFRGASVGVKYAESFQLIKFIDK